MAFKKFTTTSFTIFASILVIIFSTGLVHGSRREESAESHPCFRECSTDVTKRMTCGYNFTMDYYWILSKACYECPNVTKDCSRYDCIAADGVKRAIAVVNRMMPGPAIRVCEGDTVVVDVKNNLFGEGTAIHWHGIHMKKSPWMDGVPGVTQCPIPPGTTFRYEFETPIGGSYFWHSHAGFQRGDGVFGSLVVRKAAEKERHGPRNGKLYDFDLPEHEILIWDWLAQLSLPVFLNHHHSDGDNKPRGVLINGKGIPPGFFDDFEANQTLQTTGKPMVPLHEVRIRQGWAYRIRMISNGVLNCPLEMSIENHTMEVIAADGFDLTPITVHSLVIYAGERWDIVVRGSQPKGSYWIKFRGLMDCDDRFTSAFQVAVLNYDGVRPGTMPMHSIKSWKEAAAPSNGLQLNPLNIAPGVPDRYVTSAELSCAEDDDPEIIEQETADHQFYLSYDFNPIDNIRFHGPHIPIRTVRKGVRLYTPQLNFISHIQPISPPMIQPETMDTIPMCNDTSMKVNCSTDYCECTHWLKVRLNSIVEIILVDRGYTFDANHPFHLHGHAFRVVGMERLNKSTEPWIVQERDSQNLVSRRRSHAPIKDTVTVPDGGYTIIRFRADNPGFWFFHCHITYHVEVGMALIIQVGETSEMLKAPTHFPKCGNYLPPVAEAPIHVMEGVDTIIPIQSNTSAEQPHYSILTPVSSSTSGPGDNVVDVDGQGSTSVPTKSHRQTSRPTKPNRRNAADVAISMPIFSILVIATVAASIVS